MNYKKLFLILNISCLLFFGLAISAANIGESINFNVESNFDASGRSQVSGELIKTSANVNFFAERAWWDAQIPSKQSEILFNLDILSAEFNNRIYPILTSTYGSEWTPGVDNDPKITILFHPMKEGAGGYVRTNDEYVKLQMPNSNEREMIYLNLSHIEDQRLKVFVAHEFTHLIEFNQKERINKVEEEVWLNEGRADYSSTILGYDDSYEGSNLQSRVRDFLQNPTDSLTEWTDGKYDYATVSIFMHYLVDHYSLNVLSTSLKSKSVGIASINEALVKQGSSEDFGQIFANWTIATLVNDCSIDLKYCYLNQNLKKLKINPTLNFLPLSGTSSLSVTNLTKNWSGNWQKVIGGNGEKLTLNFSSVAGLNFQVPYLVFDKDNKYSIKFLKVDTVGKGSLEVGSFGTQNSSLVILPSLQAKTVGFDGNEFTYPYSFTASVAGSTSPGGEQDIIQKLLAQIDALKKQIIALQQGSGQTNSCVLNSNLYVGIKNTADVLCLQQFLKDKNLYPEGLVTGYFGSLTKTAVIKFQQKYSILPTGFVGIITRTKINQLLDI